MKTLKIIVISIVSTLITLFFVIIIYYLLVNDNSTLSNISKELAHTWQFKSTTYDLRENSSIVYKKLVVKKSNVNNTGGFGDWSIFCEDNMLLVLYPDHVFNTIGYGMACFREDNNELKQIKCSSKLIDKVNNHDLKRDSLIVELELYDITYGKSIEEK